MRIKFSYFQSITRNKDILLKNLSKLTEVSQAELNFEGVKPSGGA